MSGARYRKSLRGAVGASAAPYGYTLTIWTSGAVVAHGHGIPSALDALVFMAGAVIGFMAAGVLAFGGLELRFTPEERHVGGWGSFHVPSVGLAIGATWVAAQVEGVAAWPLAGFGATSTYLLVLAAQLTLAETRRG